MPIDEQIFKDIMANWGSGVTVLTTIHEGKWKGTTASSFSSVSLHPPLVLICLAHHLYTQELVQQSGVFAVNILRENQVELGKLFAGMYPEVEDRFARDDWQTAETGSPILPSAIGWVDCRVAQAHAAGDHTIFVGEVMAGSTGKAGQPLMYFNRSWGTFQKLDS